MDLTLEARDLEDIEDVLQNNLISAGVNCAMLIDMAGNIVASLDNGKVQRDIYSLAALAAGNYGAMSEMAKLLGEDEFSLLFHKGLKESIHFSKIMDELLLITIFGEDMALGFIRLKVSEVHKKINAIIAS